jgi:hypothetical protein
LVVDAIAQLEATLQTARGAAGRAAVSNVATDTAEPTAASANAAAATDTAASAAATDAASSAASANATSSAASADAASSAASARATSPAASARATSSAASARARIRHVVIATTDRRRPQQGHAHQARDRTHRAPPTSQYTLTSVTIVILAVPAIGSMAPTGAAVVLLKPA